MTADEVARARALHAEGVSMSEIGRRMGYDRRRVSEYLGASACGSCGVHLSDKRATHCARCAPEANMIWTPAALIEAIQEWAAIHGEPPAIADWNAWQARNFGDEERAHCFEAERDKWPWFIAVVERFGSWNAGIRAAGFEPRAKHGGGGNELRRRSARERVAS